MVGGVVLPESMIRVLRPDMGGQGARLGQDFISGHMGNSSE